MNGKKVLVQLGCLLNDYVNGKPNSMPKKTLAQQRELIKRKNTRAALLRQRQQLHEVYKIGRDDLRSFQEQLSHLNLALHEIPGDGNCLFRALAKGLADGSNHEQQRSNVVDFMRKHREDFEPFVEDDMPFDHYISVLEQNGTFGGNDSIVAFARLHQVNVSVHQLGLPRWDVVPNGVVQKRTLHIAYHNGEHYSAILPKESSTALAEEKWHHVLSTDKVPPFGTSVALLAYESHSITSRDTFGSDMTMDQSTLTVNSAQGSDKAMSNRKRKELEKQARKRNKTKVKDDEGAITSTLELEAPFQGLRI